MSAPTIVVSAPDDSLLEREPLRSARAAGAAVVSLVAEDGVDLARHRPDIVVAATPGWRPEDAAVLREARRRGIETVALVDAGDAAGDGRPVGDPDTFVAQTEGVAAQLAEQHGVPADRIVLGTDEQRLARFLVDVLRLPRPGAPAGPGADKVVFLVVHQGFAARFLLRTGLFRSLKAAGCRLVILVPNPEEPYLVEEFADAQVTLERLNDDFRETRLFAFRRRVLRNVPRLNRLFWYVTHLRKHMLGEIDAAPAHWGKWERWLAKERQGKPVRAKRLARLMPLANRSRAVRRLVLWLETTLYSGPVHGELFRRYRPDLVVAPSAGWFPTDAVLLREAAWHGVPAVGAVLGWDNPTSKGYRGATPDRVFAWSEVMADQLVRHHDYPRERIVVGGVPHWDHYRRPGALLEREELFERLGLDPRRKLVLLAASTPGVYHHNALVAEEIARAIESGELGVDAQLVVRLHPLHYRAKLVGTDKLEDFDAVADRHEHVHLDKPAVVSQELRSDLAAADAVHLGSLIAHCDVMLNVFSTTTLEALLVDRPVILISPEAHLSEDEKAATAARGYHLYSHQRRVMELGAARVATSLEEVVGHVRDYLADPSLDREARLQAARDETGPTDGYAGERMGRYLLELMGVPVDAGSPNGTSAQVSSEQPPSRARRRAISP